MSSDYDSGPSIHIENMLDQLRDERDEARAEVQSLKSSVEVKVRRAIALACKDIANPSVKNLDVDDIVLRVMEGK
jgi:DNA polymerase elongation subunit (family B)